jgi:hypothetical protein
MSVYTLKGQKVSKVTKFATYAAAAGCVVSAWAGIAPVQAEPVSNSYAIVGSDTLEDVVNAIVNGTAVTGSTVRVTQNGATLGSFDATGSAYITTKPGGVRFSRPNGSTEGLNALSASIGDPNAAADAVGNIFTSGFAQAGFTTVPPSLWNVNINGMVDISRSSSGGTTNVNGTIARVPFGRDAIALAMSPELAATLRTALGLSSTDTPYLTAAQLGTLFSCTGTADPTLTITNPTTLGTTVVAFNPVVPQAGSGTRKDFLSKVSPAITDNATFVGNTGSSNGTDGVGEKCIGVGQEHDATATAFTGATNSIMPMSASRWIAMKNLASFNRAGNAVLGAVSTNTTYVTASKTVVSPVVTEAAPSTLLAPNNAYYADTTWGRDVYLFVERARIEAGAKYDANLAALLDPTLNTLSNAQTNGASKVGKVKLAYGFLAPSSSALAYLMPAYTAVKS